MTIIVSADGCKGFKSGAEIPLLPPVTQDEAECMPPPQPKTGGLICSYRKQGVVSA